MFLCSLYASFIAAYISSSYKTAFLTWPCGKCFQKYFSVENHIILSLNTVIPIIVIVYLTKVTCLHKRIIHSHSVLASGALFEYHTCPDNEKSSDIF